MSNLNFLYTFNYDYHLDALCKLESRQIFDTEEKDKLLFSPIKVDPSISAFIKTRLEIISSSENYSELLEKIKKENIHIEGFTAEYLILNGDSIDRTERRKKLKDVGFCMEGIPNFTTPSITYSIGHYEDIWHFGILTKHNNDWYKHKKKPHSFSNSISMDIAKTLVGVASQGNKTKTILDACCGVGTVVLEGCCSGFDIAGCDINLKAILHTRQNLAYYNYTANLYCLDIKDHNTQYAAAIIDLPYNLYSHSDDEVTSNIIGSTAKLTNRVVIVSISDIEAVIQKSGLTVTDYCSIVKKGKSTFTRKIWICEKVSTVSVN